MSRKKSSDKFTFGNKESFNRGRAKTFYPPSFEIDDRYIFFEQVSGGEKNPYLDIGRQALNVNGFSATQPKTNNEDRITPALGFLKQVADNERAKEIKAMKGLINNLRDKLGKDNPKYIKMEKLVEQLANSKDIDYNWYLNVSEVLTAIRSDILTAKHDLQKINRRIDSNGKDLTTVKDVMQQNALFRGYGDFSTLAFRTMNFGAPKKGKKERDEFSSRRKKAADFAYLARDAIEAVLVREEYLNKINWSATNFMALEALVLMQLEQHVQAQLQSQNPGEIIDFKNASKENIDSAINFITGNDSDGGGILASLINNTIETLNLLEQVKKTLSIKDGTMRDGAKEIADLEKINGHSKHVRGRLKKIYSSKKGKGSKEEKAKIQEFSTKLFNVTLNIQRKGYKGTKNSHGAWGEVASMLLSGEDLTKMIANKIRGSAATDTIVVANLKVSAKNISTINKMSQIITDETTAQKDLLTSYSDIYDPNKNENIAERIKRARDIAKEESQQLTEQLKKLQKDNDIDNIFIFSQSVKLYQSAAGKTKSGFSDFEGRSLKISTFFAEYESIISQLSDAQLDNVDSSDIALIEMAALNCVEPGLLTHKQDTIEKYFSIFVGILMFSDWDLIINEAINTVTNEQKQSTTMVHLYPLNGTYVPLSMILFYTHKVILDAKNQIDISGMDVSISGSDFTEGARAIAANFYNLDENGKEKHGEGYNVSGTKGYYPGRWNEVRALAYNTITITFAFFRGFKKFQQELFAQMG